MRLWIVRVVDDERLPAAAGELDTQFGRNRLGNFVLNRKNIVQFAIKFFGPRLQPVLDVDQLHVDAHLIANLLQTAFQNMCYAEYLADFTQIEIISLELESRSARGHFQTGNLSERVEYFLRNAITEVGGFLVIAQIFERYTAIDLAGMAACCVRAEAALYVAALYRPSKNKPIDAIAPMTTT